MEDPVGPQGPFVVVGVDGSSGSVAALEWAARLAPSLGAGILALTVWHHESSWSPFVPQGLDPEVEAKQILSETLARAFGDRIPEALVQRCHRGRPAKVLIDQSKSARMLIVGSRGYGGFAGLLLGSVSSVCAEHAKCPVLVVHPSPQMPEDTGNHA